MLPPYKYSNKMKEAFSEEPMTNITIPSCINDQHQKYINSLIDYAKSQLKLTELPEIILTDDRNDAPMTTGSYIPEENKLFIYVKNRALCDYLRTIAHELVHVKQHLEDRIPSDLQGRNKELEAEANIAAGDIIYDFAHKDENQSIYDL